MDLITQLNSSGFGTMIQKIGCNTEAAIKIQHSLETMNFEDGQQVAKGKSFVEWNCTICSYNNALSSSNCEMCAINNPMSWKVKAYTLWNACANGKVEILKALIRVNVDVNQKSDTGFVCMYTACANGWIEVVKALLLAKAMVNIGSPAGLTPLHIACQNGKADVVKALVEAKSNINQVDNFGRRALDVACTRGNLNVIGDTVHTLFRSDRYYVGIGENNKYLDVVNLLIQARHKKASKKIQSTRINAQRSQKKMIKAETAKQKVQKAGRSSETAKAHRG
eukprot:TRINITY_DN117_c0_g1_i2.p1 TRINITY_DN117_c0_g1~~TRINITY_DN117_c0_g1_i2.p1  ORF type:complete len:280 (-),score=37.02 TRINITY_DN117_c0_g1_i2:3-842(-)